MRKPTNNEIIKEIVYAIFETRISLDDPSETIEEVKDYIRKLRSGEIGYTPSIFED